MSQADETSFYFQLSHQDIVVYIYPETYTHCSVAIGKTEVILPPPVLPFKSPAVLNCKLKIVYNQHIDEEDPYIYVNHIDRKIYKLLPLQDVSNKLSHEQKQLIQQSMSATTHNQYTPPSTISPALLKALTTDQSESGRVDAYHQKSEQSTPENHYIAPLSSRIRRLPTPSVQSPKESSRCCFLF